MSAEAKVFISRDAYTSYGETVDWKAWDGSPIMTRDLRKLPENVRNAWIAAGSFVYDEQHKGRLYGDELIRETYDTYIKALHGQTMNGSKALPFDSLPEAIKRAWGVGFTYEAYCISEELI